MPATNGFYSRILIAIALPVVAWGKDGVQTYSVPKEPVPSLLSLGSAQPQAALSRPLTWTVPTGWDEKPASRMRLGQFVVLGTNDTKAELAVMAFPGDVGGELMNVNRWRGEVGLEPIEQKDVVSELVAIGSEKGKLYEFVGAQQSTLVGWELKDETSYFFKLRGDKTVVAAAKPAMNEFLKSVKFQGAPSMAAAESIGDSAVANPHGAMPGMDATVLPAGHPPMGEAMSGMPASHPATAAAAAPNGAQPNDSRFNDSRFNDSRFNDSRFNDSRFNDSTIHDSTIHDSTIHDSTAATWQIPPHWKEQSASKMVVKSFTVSDEKAGKATITITSFPGQVGGALANVNRWRAQIGLKAITEAELPSMTKTVDVAGGKGTLVDITGKDASGHPTRLAAVMAPRSEATWFYKLLGDSSEVEREIPNLLKLAQTARFQ